MSGDNSSLASARTAGALSDPKALPTRSALGLPWRLKDHERGFEIHCTPVGWIFVLDDTIGNIDRTREGDDFLSEQRIHADYMIHAANCHHDLLAALKAALPTLRLFASEENANATTRDRDVLEKTEAAIDKAELGSTQAGVRAMARTTDEKALPQEASAKSQSDGANPEFPGGRT